jgi:TetR/AcrR family transcriptional regulator, repressor for uid operon
MLQAPDRCETPRCQIRRRQILDAATKCFAQYGFHGTSIARLCKAAQMSPGHVYHFFANKEAIIAALIERKLERELAIVDQLENAEDLFQTLVDRVDLGLAQRTDLDNAALDLEILAEAARNPAVAELVQAADELKHQRLQALMRDVRKARNQPGEPDQDAARTLVVMALFDGLAARVVCDPALDRDALIPWLRTAVQALIG